jgi:hypothetical protein
MKRESLIYHQWAIQRNKKAFAVSMNIYHITETILLLKNGRP